ncbi:MAG: hypothetical protein MHM6MM_000818 [Cercozoa sp. M6MM]
MKLLSFLCLLSQVLAYDVPIKPPARRGSTVTDVARFDITLPLFSKKGSATHQSRGSHGSTEVRDQTGEPVTVSPLKPKSADSALTVLPSSPESVSPLTPKSALTVSPPSPRVCDNAHESIRLLRDFLSLLVLQAGRTLDPFGLKLLGAGAQGHVFAFGEKPAVFAYDISSSRSETEKTKGQNVPPEAKFEEMRGRDRAGVVSRTRKSQETRKAVAFLSKQPSAFVLKVSGQGTDDYEKAIEEARVMSVAQHGHRKHTAVYGTKHAHFEIAHDEEVASLCTPDSLCGFERSSNFDGAATIRMAHARSSSKLTEVDTVEQLLFFEVRTSLRVQMSLAIDIATALAYMHKNKVAHLDVKAENSSVIVSPVRYLPWFNPEDDIDTWGEVEKSDEESTLPSIDIHAVLLDLGLAQDEVSLRRQSGASVGGSPIYMAPEAIGGIKPEQGIEALMARDILLAEVFFRVNPVIALDAVWEKVKNETVPAFLFAFYQYCEQKSPQASLLDGDDMDLPFPLLAERHDVYAALSKLIHDTLYTTLFELIPVLPVPSRCMACAVSLAGKSGAQWSKCLLSSKKSKR